MMTGLSFNNQSKVFRLLILILILVMETWVGFAEGGFKYFRNYPKNEYDHHPQNWCVIQDNDGIIFVGNLGGVLEYDGVSWRLIEVPNNLARVLVKDTSGTIYVGGKSELGYLSPNQTGEFQYKSLLDRLEAKDRNFGSIVQAFAAPDGIYFRAANYLFRWDSKQFTTWYSDPGFWASYLYNKKLYVQQKEAGLQVLENGSFRDIPGGSDFADKKDARRIIMMVPFGGRPHTFLIGTRAMGLYLYDGMKAARFPTQADNLLTKQRNLLHGILLSSGDFALATDGVGVIIIDSSGKIKQRFDTSYGLATNNVKYLYQEPGGNLWLALNNGIAKIEYESPFTIYDQRSQLPGAVLSFVKHAPSGTYYAGTTEGLFKFSPSGSFQPVKEIYSSCRSLISHDDSIIAATENGVFVVRNNTIVLIDIQTPFCLFHSREAPNRIWAGAKDTLISYTKNKTPEQWEVSAISLKDCGYIQSIVEEPDGTLWLGTLTQGVFSVSFPNNSAPVINHYGGTDGLPMEDNKTIGEINVAYIADHMLFATQHGLYRFDKPNRRFVRISIQGKDSTGEKDFDDGAHPIFRIAEDSKGNIWFHSESVNYEAVLLTDRTYRIENMSLFRIPIVQTNSIYPEPEAIWLCTYEGLIRYATTFRFKEPQPFLNFIRRIERIDDKKTLFCGHRQKPSDHSISPHPVFSYDYRNLRFFFAAPFYQDESANLYSYFLKGYDKGWSQWSLETRRDYTNLNVGSYTFYVKAKNVYGQTALQSDSFSFKILPPWYRTPLAYIFYVIAAGGALYGVVKFRYRRLEYEKKRLETVVEQRTHEIKEKNLQLEEQTHLLTLQSEQLKEMDNVKSRFFANISHEFRTPLTLIMGPLEQILSASPDPELKNKAQLMLRNSQRLLGLINQLLDLSRLRSGKMRLQATRKNIIPFLRGIMSSFQLLSEQRQIQLLFLPQQDDITLYFNSENVEQILCNLLSNSFKNTLPGGSVTVSAAITQIPQKIAAFPDGFLEISVSDTGVGIPADQLPHVFELFYQVQAPHEQKSKGSGIGLSLARELVELHYGDIQVRSVEGKGAEFFIYLPLGKSHLKPEEIIDVTRQPISRQNDDSCKTAIQNLVPDLPEPGESAASTSAPSPFAPSDLEKPLILVVDDNPDLRRYLCSAFESAFRVIEAVDGKDGWGKAAETIPDLIISDVMMPQMDGFELTRCIKQDTRTCHIPIILLTAGASHEGMLEGLETGADDYIPKPFSMELLAARVKNLIELRRQLQERMKNQLALQPHEISVSPMDEEFYNDLRQVIEKNLSDPEFSVEGLSDKLYMGRTTVYRKILALTGETPNQLIRSYRLRRAAQLLKAHAGTVSEVAAMVGFLNPSYFAHCFKEEYHISPSDTNEENNKSFSGVEGAVLQKSPLPAAEPEDLHKGGRSPHELILVVEDSPDMCDYIRAALEPHYRVETAYDGPQGLERAQDLIPDLIVSDIMMPGFDGFELRQRLKSDISTSHIPIVLLTARASEKDILKGFENGVDDYIIKPFNTDILLARIRVILRLRSHLQAKRKRQLRLEPDEIVVSSMDEKFLEDVNRCIEENLADFDFNVEELADKLSIGRTTLYRKVLALTGENPTHYIRSFRLNKAAHILKTQDRSITDVALDVGFSSTPYFTRCFKEMFHRLPSGFRDVESSDR